MILFSFIVALVLSAHIDVRKFKMWVIDSKTLLLLSLNVIYKGIILSVLSKSIQGPS